MGFISMLFRVNTLAVLCILSASARFEDVLVTHDRLCLRTSLLRKRRGISEPPESRRGAYIKCCGYCSTDESCFYLGSCCLKEYTNFKEGIRNLAQTRYSCVGLDRQSKERHWMGTKCPPGTQDGAVKQLCENSDVRTSFESIFPVTDSSSHFSYINRYCAICNGADLHPLAATWKVEISCNDFIPSATSNLLSTLRKENCDISFQAPLAASTCELPPYTISECNKTGKWSVYDHEIDLACNSFIDPFNYTYMNYFCYVSNTDKVISIRQIQNLCPEPFPEMTITTPSGPQFTMVLELNSIRKMEAEIVLSCDSTTHFVDFKKMVCREIFCSMGHRLTDSQCLPGVSGNQRFCLAIYFWFTIIQGHLAFSEFGNDANMVYFEKEFFKHVIDASDSVKEFLIFLDKNSTNNFEDIGLNDFIIYMVMEIPENDINLILDKLRMANLQIIALESNTSTALFQIFLDRFDMNISQSEPLEAEIYITRPNEIKPRIFSLFRRGQVLSEDPSRRNDDATCLRTELIPFSKVLSCPYIKVNIKDIHMSIQNDTLISDLGFGKDMAFARWMYERNGEDIHLCLQDYEKIFRLIPIPVAIPTPLTGGTGSSINQGHGSILYLSVIWVWYCTNTPRLF